MCWSASKIGASVNIWPLPSAAMACVVGRLESFDEIVKFRRDLAAMLAWGWTSGLTRGHLRGFLTCLSATAAPGLIHWIDHGRLSHRANQGRRFRRERARPGHDQRGERGR